MDFNDGRVLLIDGNNIEHVFMREHPGVSIPIGQECRFSESVKIGGEDKIVTCVVHDQS